MATADSTRIPRTCGYCGGSFFVPRRYIKNGRGTFCSRVCKTRGLTVPLIDRFFRYVGRKQPNGCIPWTGATNSYGYGAIDVGGKAGPTVAASRVAYEMFVGPIPAGLFVCHRCDNPPCVNPAHLFLDTNAGNTADKVRKGRQNRGENHGSARLTAASVVEIRRRWAAGGTTYTALAVEYGVSRPAITKIVTRRHWSHIGG